MDSKKVVENILLGVPAAIGKLRNGWRDVLTLFLKTPFSAAIPFYSSVPGDAALQALQPKAVPQLQVPETVNTNTSSAATPTAKSPRAEEGVVKTKGKKKGKVEVAASTEMKTTKKGSKQLPDTESKNATPVVKDSDSASDKKKVGAIKKEKDGESESTKPPSSHQKKRKSSGPESAAAAAELPSTAQEQSSAAPQTLSADAAPETAQDAEIQDKAVRKRPKVVAKEVKEPVAAANPPILDLAQAEAALQALETELAGKKKSNKKDRQKKTASTVEKPAPTAAVAVAVPPIQPPPVAEVAAIPAAEVSTGRVTRSRSRSNSMASDSGDEGGKEKVVKAASKPARIHAMPAIAEEAEAESTDRKRKTPAKKAAEPAAASDETAATPKRRKGEAAEPASSAKAKAKVEKGDKEAKASEASEPSATRKRSKSSAKGE